VNNIWYYISTKEDANLALHTWDVENEVINNRKNLSSKLWFSLEDFVYLNQIHSYDVIIASNDDKWTWVKSHELAYKADWIVTNKSNIVIWVLIADCVPVLLLDRINGVIWVVHAWWKSTNKKIVKKAINNMLTLGADINNINAIIWPSINSCSYQVWEDVWNNFRSEVKTKIVNWKQFLDIKKENSLQLLESWVKESNINNIWIDTFTDSEYFSARREWYSTWRFGAFIWIK